MDTDRKWQLLTDPILLKKFFEDCNEREQGVEPDWEEHKNLNIGKLSARDLVHLSVCQMNKIRELKTFDQNLLSAFRKG